MCIQTITVKHNDRVRTQVTSPDMTDEIHLHGYDLMRDLKAGGRVRFSFDAKDEGIFEIELEGAGTVLGFERPVAHQRHRILGERAQPYFAANAMRGTDLGHADPPPLPLLRERGGERLRRKPA